MTIGLSGHSSIIDTYYCCSGHSQTIHLASVENSSFSKYIEKLARDLWEREALAQGYDPVIIQAYGERLSKAVKEGFGKDYVDIDYDSKDYKLLHSLESNVWQFSTAKNYQQLKQMSEALIKPDGTRRSYEEFRIQTAIITGGQLRHLKTEYQTAVAGAQMAAKWNEIQKNKDIYPLLEFDAVEDDHTSALCRSLDGVIRPVDDAFWMQFYPPNHYNCRSTVKQLRKGEVTPDDQIVRPNIPGIFKVNLGERGLAFPEDHAYFDGMPPELMKEARKHFPYNMQFDLLDLSDDAPGIVRQHFMVDTLASDYQRILNIALEKAKKDKQMIDILPELNPNKWNAMRPTILPDSKTGKSPDLRINKVLWEEEGVYVLGKNTISNAIKDGARQANNIIISLLVEDYPGDEYLFNKAKGAFNVRRYLDVIEFRHKEKVLTFQNPYKSKGD